MFYERLSLLAEMEEHQTNEDIKLFYKLGTAIKLMYDGRMRDNVRAENGKAPAHIRIGWLRSVNNIIQSFSVNIFADELTIKAGKDPLQFRLGLIGNDRIEESPSGNHFDSSKLKNVLKKVAINAEYGKKLPEGHGIGFAVHYSFYSYVASVIEVSDSVIVWGSMCTTPKL